MVTTKFTEEIQKEFEERGANVKWFGAKGDGITDDSEAIQTAIQYCSQRNIELFFPTGKYKITKNIFLFSNTHLLFSNKETILYGPGCMLIADSEGKGYDGGPKNITISGGVIRGDFDSPKGNLSPSGSGRLAGSFHHVSNMKITGTSFIHCVSNSHAFDLAGCRDIYFEDCDFIGALPEVKDREHVEAIQIDYSYYKGLSHKTEKQESCCDGLPTKDVLIKNCRFLPEYDSNGAIKYYAPSGIGNHADIASGIPENIRIIGCTFKDVLPEGTSFPGWIHFSSVKNLLVSKCSFSAEEGTNHNGTAVHVDSWSNPVEFEGNTSPLKAENITIEYCSIKGLRPSLFSPIRIKGNSSHPVEEVTIYKNRFKDMTTTRDLIQLVGVKDSSIEHNKADKIRRFLWIPATNPIIGQNKIKGNSATGVEDGFAMVMGFVGELLIADNFVSNGKGTAVYVRGMTAESTAVVSSNYFTIIENSASTINGAGIINEGQGIDFNIILNDNIVRMQNGDPAFSMDKDRKNILSYKGNIAIGSDLDKQFIPAVKESDRRAARKLWSGITSTGILNLNDALNHYTYLIVLTGAVSGGTWTSSIVYPYIYDGGVWRVEEDLLSCQTSSGKLLLKVASGDSLEILSNSVSVRGILGVY